MIVKNYILIFLLNTCKKGTKKKSIDIKIRLIIIFSSAQQNGSVSLRQSKILFFSEIFFNIPFDLLPNTQKYTPKII